MTLRNLLLRAYPRSWRDEYGAEVAGILARTSLTPGMVADVLGGAARQHFYRDAPWKICGAGLALWNLILVLFVRAGLLTDRSSFLWCYTAGMSMFLFAAGAWTVVRKQAGVWRSTGASAKAALVGHSPLVARYLLLFRRGGGSTVLSGHSIYFWFGKTLAISLLLSLALGFAGALWGKFLTGFRRRLRET